MSVLRDVENAQSRGNSMTIDMKRKKRVMMTLFRLSLEREKGLFMKSSD